MAGGNPNGIPGCIPDGGNPPCAMGGRGGGMPGGALPTVSCIQVDMRDGSLAHPGGGPGGRISVKMPSPERA